MNRSASPVPAELAAVTRTLWLDAVAASVVRAFDEAGVPSVLLKGPATAHWFYQDTPRIYGDIDLLVPPDRLAVATTVLEDLGYTDWLAGVYPQERAPHADVWVGADATVDLHRTLSGAEAPAEEVWEVVHAHTMRLPSHPEILIPDLSCSLLVLGAHAAHHGLRGNQPLRDLARTLVVAKRDDWVAADALARAVGAHAFFTLGLCLLPEGRRLATSLGIHAPYSRRLRVNVLSAIPTAVAWRQFLELRGTRRIIFLWRWAFPSRRSLVSRYPIARRGSAGSALARTWHPVFVVLRAIRHGPRAFVALRRARRQPDREGWSPLPRAEIPPLKLGSDPGSGSISP